MRKIKSYIFVLLLYSFTVSFAQNKKAYSLYDIIKIGLEKNFQIQLSQLTKELQNKKLDEAKYVLLPNLKFNFIYTQLSEIIPFRISIPNQQIEISPYIQHNYYTKISLQQPIFTGFKISNSIATEKKNLEIADENFEKEKSELIYKIKLNYFSILKLKKNKTAINENIKLLKTKLNDIKNLIEEGLVLHSDSLKIKIQISNLEIALLEIKNNISNLVLNLKFISGINENETFEIDTTYVQKKYEENSLDKCVELAKNNRSEIKNIQTKLEIDKLNEQTITSNLFPQIFFFGNYYYSRPNNRIFPFEDKFNTTWDLGINFSYDINWNQIQNQIEQTKIQTQTEYVNLKLIENNIQLEITQLYMNLIYAKEKISVAKTNLELCEENSKIVNEKFRNGITLTSDLLESQTILYQAEVDYFNSILDYEIANLKLEKSIGKNF